MKAPVQPFRGVLAGLVAAYSRLPRSLRWATPVAWAGAIWWASSQSRLVTAEGTGWTFAANGAHFVIFGVLAALVFLAGGGSDRRRAWTGVVLAVLYAIIDELHQAQVPGRDASVWDVCSDAVGASWFTAALLWVRSGGRGSFLALAVLLPIALLSVALATFG